MSLAFVAAATGTALTPATSQALPVTISATGHIIFLYVENASGIIDCTVSVSGVGGTWNKIGTSTNDADVWFNTTYNLTGAQTLTVTMNTSTACRFTFAEYSGQFAGYPIDTFSFSVGAGTNITASVNAGFTNDTLILWTGTNSGGTTFTTSTGMTSRANLNGMAILDLNETAAGHYTMAGTWDANPFGSNDTLIAVKSTASVGPPSGGDVGPGYDFKFRL